ncbi:hypothetical protein EX30DRAFT_364382 [Ascodesmis nigricans]|uniref:T6SS Phospholipase effector Tle1-like catalytic domain-containing protein n=1 Tax=Ascodesmis nigricans TaxID=341454 RepID=A0A4S2MVT9_9PEZI|nr:hypothetical protein EX30DRAFT_364382 [Ascodesmis nigricans]
MSKSQHKPEVKNTQGLPVRLVICLDGTGDTASGSYSAVDGQKSGGADSIYTIYRMTKAGVVAGANGKQFFQRVGYFEGVGTVGTEDGGEPNMLIQGKSAFDGATGHGYLDILRSAYKLCCQELQPIQGENHELLIFGFSRGAFISRALASFLQHVGLIKYDRGITDKEFENKFEKVLLRYGILTQIPIPTFWKKNAKSKTAVAPELLDFCVPCPRIRLLGAFDTVKTTYPIPRTDSKGRPIYIDFQMDAPLLVDNFRHALALNEQRFLFNPDLWHLDASSDTCSYLEAWFFGFHHDIGGGDAVQGLALWPLQWILHEASDLGGLVLDPNDETYRVIFTGHEGLKVIDTPHDIMLRMFDIINHHQSEPRFGLKLNQPFSYTFPVPRKYTKFLTQPPYSKWLRPKVFVHPSAYLIFDVSTDFRLQVYQWEYFHSFLQGRCNALSQNSAPWWEKHTIDSILKENVAAKHLNILVMGQRGTDKAGMVRKIFGAPEIPLTTSIHNPIPIPGNNQVRIHFSHGFDSTTGSDSRESVEVFLRHRRDDVNPDTRLHAIWYFIDATQENISPSEKEFFEMDFGSIPIVIIYANEDKLLSKIQEKAMAAAKDPSLSFEQARKALQAVKDVAMAFEHLAMATRKLTAQLGNSPAIKKTVHAKNPNEAPKNLLAETYTILPDLFTQTIAIKAQRLEVKQKIALATEESIRAYVTWYMYQQDGKPRQLSRSSDVNAMNLTHMLMEPILSTFNIRFKGDTDLIISEIGDAWKDLNNADNNLCHPTVDGKLILLCTLDTIMVMTRALTHNSDSNETEEEKTTASALTEEDIKRASRWYKGSKQKETHTRICELLTAEGTPKDNSIATLQMKVIEIVESQTKRARKTSAVVTKVKDVLGDVSGSTVLLASVGLLVCLLSCFVAGESGLVISHLQQLKTFVTQSLGVLMAVGITGMIGTAGATVFLAKWLKANPAAGNVGNQSIPRLQSLWRSWLVRNNGVAA